MYEMYNILMQCYGLSEELLESVLNQALTDEKPQWYLKGIPNVGFYQELHPFLKMWPVTSRLTIGRFYIAIDPNMKQKGIRADNVYRLIDRICKSGQPSNMVMSYGRDEGVADIKAMQVEAERCTQQVETLTSEYQT